MKRYTVYIGNKVKKLKLNMIDYHTNTRGGCIPKDATIFKT